MPHPLNNSIIYYVVVEFYFPLFWDMLMDDSELKTKRNKIETKDKIEHQHMYTLQHCYYDNYINIKMTLVMFLVED